MKKVLLSIDECRSGMVLSEDVLNIYGTMIAPKGAVLNQSVIDKLVLNDIEYLSIKAQSNELDRKKQRKFFIQTYNESVSMQKNLMKDIGNGKNIDLEVVCAMGNHLLDVTEYDNAYEIFDFLKAIKVKDDYTYCHSVNVSLIVLIIGRWLGFDEEKLRNLTYSGLLHDIGKTRICKAILTKPDKLSESEYDEMKKHPQYGYEIVKASGQLPECVALGVLAHHERANGKGYPYGLIGDDIHEFGKVIAVADIYDAMTSERVYHKPENPFKVFEMFQNHSLGLIDADILITFVKRMVNYYIGDKVILNDGREAQIVFVNQDDIARPFVKIGESIVNLSKERDVSIETLLSTE